MRKAWALAASLAGLCHCSTVQRVDDGPRVAVLGRVQASGQEGPQLPWMHCGESVQVAFGPERSGGEVVTVSAKLGEFFEVSLPRRPTFLKWVSSSFAESPLALAPLGAISAPTCKPVVCQVRQRVDVAPDDARIYVGTLVCLPDGVFEAKDDARTANEDLSRLFQGATPVVRIPHPEEP